MLPSSLIEQTPMHTVLEGYVHQALLYAESVFTHRTYIKG